MATTLTRRALLKNIASSAAAGLSLPAFSAGETILIGQSIHLSGPAAPSMVRPIKGQELAIEDFNRKGGAGGRKVRLIMLDDAYDAKRTAENIQTLIDKENVTALYGLGSTAAVTGVLPIILDKKIPLISVYTGAPSLRLQHHPYFFTTMASYRDEVVKMVSNLTSSQRRKIAVCALNTAFGKEMVPIIEEVAKSQGATVVGTQLIEMNGSNAVAACQKLGETKPDGLIMMVFGGAVVPLVRAARNFVGVPIYAPTIANSKLAIDALGDDARGLAFTRILPNALRTVSAVTRDYSAVMQRANIPVDYDHFFGYLNMRVLLEGVRRAGKNTNPQTLVAAMQKIGDIDLGGYKLSYSPTNHHGSKLVDLSIIGPGGRYIM